MTLQPSNSDFLAELARAAPLGSRLWTCAFEQDPARGDWRGGAWDGNGTVDEWSDRNSYFSVGAVKDPAAGRKRTNFAALLALVADDADPDRVRANPSWVLRTSPGKYQVGVFLDPDDPDRLNAELIDALLREFIRRGAMPADASGNNLVRYARLPRGTNTKSRASGPSPHEIVQWNPQVRMSLADAAAVFGVDLEEVRASLRERTKPVSTGSIDGNQSEKLEQWVANIVSGESYHTPIAEMAASLLATGMHPGAATSVLRGLMQATPAFARDTRWEERWREIPRAVRTGEEKYYRGPATSSLGALATVIEEPLFAHAGTDSDDVQPTDWLIDDWVGRGKVMMMFGETGSKKSFVAISMAACIATGTPWYGNPVTKGPVFYIAGEGESGLKKRFKVWALNNPNAGFKDAPCFYSRRGVLIDQADQFQALMDEVERMTQQYGPPALIIIDTLNANFSGEENDAQDAGAILRLLKQAIALPLDCAVMIVHHSGKDAERGARGSSAFKAGVDIEVAVKKLANHGVQVALTKSKDDSDEMVLEFQARVVEIPGVQDKRGRPVTSLYLDQVGVLDDVIWQCARQDGGEKLGVSLRMVINACKTPEGRFSWQGRPALMAGLRITERAAKTLMDQLKAKAFIEPDKAGWKFAEAAIEAWNRGFGGLTSDGSGGDNLSLKSDRLASDTVVTVDV